MAPLKVGVAMSGGVDSTMAASLLLEQGFSVQGFFMQLPLARQAVLETRVRQVAACLDVPLHLVDLRQPFNAEVIAPFIATYREGRTPNPCVCCNHCIKFGRLLQAMRDAGMDRMATGHYARIIEEDGYRWIGRGGDGRKDQSYFLARLQANQLESLLFPLGDWTKEAVYRRATALGFDFDGEESQDVCFLEQELPSFLAEHGLGEQAGPVVTGDGCVIGEHRGVWRYTIGQRRGLGLPDVTPWYVVGLDGAKNRVMVGKQEVLWQDRCQLLELRWTHAAPMMPWRGLVQLRSRHQPALAELSGQDRDTWQLVFDQPQRAITPGQFAVFYEGQRVLGSAVIAPGATEASS